MNIEEIRIMKVPPLIRVADAKLYFAMSERIVRKLLVKNEIVGSKKTGSRHWILNSASIFKYLKRNQNTRQNTRKEETCSNQ